MRNGFLAEIELVKIERFKVKLMTEPTQAQIEAATKAVTRELSIGGSDENTIAIAALTAAAEVGEQKDDEDFYHINDAVWLRKRALERQDAAIERCAQVAENTPWHREYAIFRNNIVAAIRALKDK